MAILRMYLQFSHISFRRAAAYRFDVWTRMFANIMFLLMWIFVWGGLYSGKAIVSGVSFQATLSYVLISHALQGLHGAGTPLWEIQEQVRTGNIAVEFMRPYDYPMRLLFADFGGIAFYFLTAVFPLYTVLFFLFSPTLPATFSQWLLFLVSAALGYLIRYSIELTFGLFTFWLIETGGVEDIFYFSVSLFSGSLVPLWFFPGWLQTLAGYLPFQGIFFVPNAIFVGEIAGAEIFTSLLVQLFWLLISYLLLRLVWIKASGKIVVQGG